MKKFIYAKPYQAFYKKRLQTQSFLESEVASNTLELTSRIIDSLKNAKQEVMHADKKLSQAKERLKTKERQESLSRQSLRFKISQKMRLSQTNIQKLKSQRKKMISSRSKFEQKTRKTIREKQKLQLQRSLLKSKQYQSETEKFFQEEEKKKRQEYKRLQKLSPVEKYQKMLLNSNISLLSNTKQSSISKKKHSHFLKINDADLKLAQKKKEELQNQKESRYLQSCLKKMESIDRIKQRFNSVPRKMPVSTLPKVQSQSREHLTYRDSSASRRRPENHSSFSLIYEKKLSQKRQKKQQFHSLILNRGDKILEKEQRQTAKLKEQKIIKDSINQYKRWSNYLLREKR